MLEYSKVFPRSPLAFWDSNPRVRRLRDGLARLYFSIAGRAATRVLRQYSPACIPIVIINFNRLEAMKLLIDWLLRLQANIVIIILDNNSTFAPLLAYYQSLDHPLVKVVSLPRNIGPNATLRLAPALKRFRKYIITDSDLIPTSTTPADLLQRLSDTLDQYPAYNHVGASLEVDDLPGHYPFARLVREWEAKFWVKPLNEDLYEAAVDTTFAMYRGSSDLRSIGPALRLARPYTLKHLDWYIDPACVSDEYAYYLKTCTSHATWATKLKHEKLDWQPT